MNNTSWVFLNTATTGFSAPVFVVELAAQRMLGWEPDGEPFRKLLNQSEEMPLETLNEHKYTREILERDGEPAIQVYQAFADYAGDLPLVAFNLHHHLNEVLLPEWERLRISTIGRRGICALRLAQRLLDPLPVGHCNLRTLGQYYRLSKNEPQTALGDVQTVADLLARVLRPIAEKQGLITWENLTEYAEAEWFPSQIAFGKYKGRFIQDAYTDADFRGWLEWLSNSSNSRSASMGRWYLRHLEKLSNQPEIRVDPFPEFEDEARPENTKQSDYFGLIFYTNPELEELRRLVASARARLAELEGNYTKEKSRVDVVQAKLFRQLRDHYQKRDKLRLILDYRRKFLKTLLRSGEEEAKQTESHYERAKEQTDQDYEEAAAAVADKTQLTPEQEEEMTQLWKKLVKLYHPDKYGNQPEKQETYSKLTTAINNARDAGDFKLLNEIAEDPEGFIRNQGWIAVDLSDTAEIEQLRRLHEMLQLNIISVLESLNQLRKSSDYALAQRVEEQPEVLDELVAKLKKQIEAEIAEMEVEAERLAQEIEELTGEAPTRII